MLFGRFAWQLIDIEAARAVKSDTRRSTYRIRPQQEKCRFELDEDKAAIILKGLYD